MVVHKYSRPSHRKNQTQGLESMYNLVYLARTLPWLCKFWDLLYLVCVRFGCALTHYTQPQLSVGYYNRRLKWWLLTLITVGLSPFSYRIEPLSDIVFVSNTYLWST